MREEGIRGDYSTVFSPSTTKLFTGPDLLAYCHLGNPIASPTAENKEALQKKFKAQKSYALDNADTKIKWLISGLTTNPSKALERAGSITVPLFSRLKLVLSMLSSSTEGCEFLAANGAAVAEAIRCCPKLQQYAGETRPLQFYGP